MAFKQEQAAERAAIAAVFGDRMMTVVEVAQELGRTQGHVRKVLESGAIPGARKAKDGRAVRKNWRVSSLAIARPASDWEMWAAYTQEFSCEQTTYEDFMALVPAGLVRAQQKRHKVLIQKFEADQQRSKVFRIRGEVFEGTLEPAPDGLTTRAIAYSHPWTEVGRVHWVRHWVRRIAIDVPNRRVPEVSPWPAVEPVETLNYGTGPLELSAREIAALPLDVRRARKLDIDFPPLPNYPPQI